VQVIFVIRPTVIATVELVAPVLAGHETSDARKLYFAAMAGVANLSCCVSPALFAIAEVVGAVVWPNQ